MEQDPQNEETRVEEFDLLLGNLTSANPSIEIKKGAHDVNIVCTTCTNPIALPANFAGTHADHCRLCDQPVSVEMIYTNDDMSILELKGCEYGRPAPLAILGSVTDSERTKVGSNPFATAEKSFVDNLLAHWEVRTGAGEVFHFEYFSAIRKWIGEGKLKGGDEIIPADGRHYRLETYPGTADLFGNVFLRNEARAGISNRSAVVLPRQPKRKMIWRHVLLTLGLAIVAGITPDVIQSIRIRTGDKLIRRLVQLETAVTPEKYLTEVLNANDHFRRGTAEDLKLAEKSYLRALALKPNDPEVIGGLVETWVQTSVVSSPILGTGQALLRYAGAKFPENTYILRASARLEHKKGESASALKKLHRALSKDANDPDTHALIAMIAMDQGDFTTATLHLNQSLTIDPTNLTRVNEFVTLFERQSKYPEAAEYLQRMAALSGNSNQYADRLADLYTKANDPAGVETVYREAIRRGQDREHFQATLIEFLSAQKRTDDVVRESLIYIENFPSGESVLKVRGIYTAALGTERAVTNRASESDSTDSTPSTHTKRRSSRSRRNLSNH